MFSNGGWFGVCGLLSWFLCFGLFFSYFSPLLPHRGIFRLLARYQLEHKDNPSYPGIPHLFGVLPLPV